MHILARSESLQGVQCYLEKQEKREILLQVVKI
jgi:hypothetical protein